LRIRRASKRPAPDGQEAGKRADPSLRLVYYEFFQTLGDAIVRERQLKTWERRWKVELIETVNPRWDDLSGRLMA